MINNIDFEAYQSYLQLQAEYKAIYKGLERQYQMCRCMNCKRELILFSVDLLNLNTLVAHLENQISPAIGTVLSDMQIDHIITDGKATLT